MDEEPVGDSPDFLLTQEIVKAAKAKLSGDIWDYLMGGAETETTLWRNRLALDSIAFRPRVLRDVSSVDCGSEILGHKQRIPVVLAPIGSLQDLEPGGGASAARAADRFGILSMHSIVTDPSLEEIATAATGAKVYQLYIQGDRHWLDAHIARIVAAGYCGVCITVDLDAYGCRERDTAKRFVTTSRKRPWPHEFQARFCWDDVVRLKETLEIPLVVKGIATAEDAHLCCEHGVDAVYVSNHGGRQLDHGRGTVEILPEVVDAVGGRSQVIVDGGFMRGTDVVKAIALGADAVGIGKLLGLAIAAAGENGIVRALEILEREIQTCLALLGATSLDELDTSLLHPSTPSHRTPLQSVFPLLDEGY